MSRAHLVRDDPFGLLIHANKRYIAEGSNYPVLKNGKIPAFTQLVVDGSN